VTFDVDVGDLEAMEASLTSLSEELCRRLGARDLRGRTIGIKVRLDDWTNVTRSHTLDQPTNDPERVTTVALDLLRAYAPPRPVRLLGVRVAQFGDPPRTDDGAAEPEPQLRLGLPAA
jgi:DNA polymerase-4